MSLTSARNLNQVQHTITVEITAVEFRRLNSFEWAVLKLLDTFQRDTPTIANATVQLNIVEPAFLVAALESLRSVGAVQPKTDETRRLDLNDYELSETGKTIMREDGWESGDENRLREDIALDWPSLKILPNINRDKQGDAKQSQTTPDEVQERLTLEIVEEWLNTNDASRVWRAKSFLVTNVSS